VESHGFTGVHRTLRQFVSHCHEQLENGEENYNQLSHPKEEAQVDLGTFLPFFCGCLTEFRYLVVIFPYRNTGFIQATPGKNSDCLLEGGKEIVEHIGSVASKIRFDNKKSCKVKFRDCIPTTGLGSLACEWDSSVELFSGWGKLFL